MWDGGRKIYLTLLHLKNWKCLGKVYTSIHHIKHEVKGKSIIMNMNMKVSYVDKQKCECALDALNRSARWMLTYSQMNEVDKSRYFCKR